MGIKTLLLRVGVDTGQNSGGTLAPIYPDGTWSYIPIPDLETNFPLSYGQIPTNNNKTLADWLPKKFRRLFPHYDPEFWTYSYGEPISGAVKQKQLLKLKKGDFLLFWAGLTKNEPDLPKIYANKTHEPIEAYLIGFFEIDEIVQVPANFSKEAITDLNLTLNAHSLRLKREKYLAARGNPDNSKLLKYPLKLTNNDKKSNEMRRMLPIQSLIEYGLEKISFRSGAGNWVPEKAFTYLQANIQSDVYPEWIKKQELEKLI